MKLDTSLQIELNGLVIHPTVVSGQLQNNPVIGGSGYQPIEDIADDRFCSPVAVRSWVKGYNRGGVHAHD